MNAPLPSGHQRFTISHHDEAAFKTGGLRNYSSYRDLGVAEATNGLAHAHVIRMIAPYRPELSLRHHHNVQFQMVYCLTGWFETEFEGVAGAAGCGLELGATPNIRHTVVGWSDDCELLEILVPAEHETVNDA